MSQEVVTRYRLEVQDAEKAAEQLASSVEQVGEKSEESGKKGDKAFKDTGKSAMSLRNGLIDLSNVAEGVLPLGQFQSGIRMMRTFSGVVGVSTGAVKTKSIALKGLRMALIATGIGAFVVIIAALVSWLQRSIEGVDFLRRATAVFGEIIDSVGGLLAQLGGRMISVFSDPLGAIRNLRDAIVNNITNRITGLIRLFPRLGQAVSQALSGDFRGAARTAADAIGQVALGVESVTQKLQNFGNNINSVFSQVRDAASEAAALAQATSNLDREMEEFAVTQAKTNFEVAKAMDMARDETVAIGERNDALKGAAALVEANMEQEMEFARRRLEIARRDADINDNEDAARKARLEAEAEFFKTQERMFNERRRLRRFEVTLQRQQDREEQEMNDRRVESEQELAALRATTTKDRIKLIEEERDRALESEELLQSERELIRERAKVKIQELVAAEEAAELERMDKILQAELELAGMRAQTVDERIQHERDKKGAALAEIARMEEEAREQGLDDLREFALQREIIEQGAQDRIADIRDEQRDEHLQKEKELRKELENVAQQSVNDVMRIMNNMAQHRINMIDNMLERELISEEDAARQKAEIQREQAKREKAVAIAQAIINTAVAVTNALKVSRILAAAVAVAGGIQIAAIRSEPVPTFARGGIDIQGRGTSTSDSIPARLSKGESVITAKGTKRNKQLLQDINKGRELTYIDPKAGGSVMSRDEASRAMAAIFNDEGIRHEIRRSVEEQLNSQGTFARMIAKETAREITRNNRYK